MSWKIREDFVMQHNKCRYNYQTNFKGGGQILYIVIILAASCSKCCGMCPITNTPALNDIWLTTIDIHWTQSASSTKLRSLACISTHFSFTSSACNFHFSALLAPKFNFERPKSERTFAQRVVSVTHGQLIPQEVEVQTLIIQVPTRGMHLYFQLLHSYVPTYFLSSSSTTRNLAVLTNNIYQLMKDA